MKIDESILEELKVQLMLEIASKDEFAVKCTERL